MKGITIVKRVVIAAIASVALLIAYWFMVQLQRQMTMMPVLLPAGMYFLC